VFPTFQIEVEFVGCFLQLIQKANSAELVDIELILFGRFFYYLSTILVHFFLWHKYLSGNYRYLGIKNYEESRMLWRCVQNVTVAYQNIEKPRRSRVFFVALCPHGVRHSILQKYRKAPLRRGFLIFVEMARIELACNGRDEKFLQKLVCFIRRLARFKHCSSKQTKCCNIDPLHFVVKRGDFTTESQFYSTSFPL
jgi:hypothetical protein